MKSLKILYALNDIDEQLLEELCQEDTETFNDVRKWFKNLKIKYILSPIFALILIVIFIVKPYKINKNEVNSEKITTNSLYLYDISININEIKTSNKIDMDIEAKESNYYNIPYFEIVSDLKIPDDFDNKDSWKAIWVKSNEKLENYDVLNNYEYNCFNTQNNRKITISFSDKHKPLRDYYFIKEDDEISNIKAVELKIYKQDKMYIAIFNYKNFNFDIETIDISEEELIDLLKSIIK